jgi:uncharacterized protein
MKFLPERRPISSYGDGGFRFGDHSHRGDLMVLPSGMRAWDGADFSGVLAEKDEIDFLIVGTGTQLKALDPRLAVAMEAAGISADCMATSAAVATYNVMLAEGRRVAAAFIVVA